MNLLVRTVPLYQHKSVRRARSDQLVSEIPEGANREDWLQHVEIQVDHRDPRATSQENLSPVWSGPVGDGFASDRTPERGHTVPMSSVALAGLADAAGDGVVPADSAGRTQVYAVRADLMPGREEGSMEIMPRSARESSFGLDAQSWYRQQEAMVAAQDRRHPARTAAGRTRRRLSVPTDPAALERIGRETARSASLGASAGRAVPRVGPVVGGTVGGSVGMLRAARREGLRLDPLAQEFPQPPAPSPEIPDGPGGWVGSDSPAGGADAVSPARSHLPEVPGPGAGGSGSTDAGPSTSSDMASRMDQALMAGRARSRHSGTPSTGVSVAAPPESEIVEPEPEMG